MELEQKRMPISTEKTFTDERLQAEKKQVENKEKVIDMKEKDKLALKFTYSKLDKNILKWTELLVAFEATIHRFTLGGQIQLSEESILQKQRRSYF